LTISEQKFVLAPHCS